MFYCILWVASFFNSKANQWIRGRKGQFKQIENDIKKGDLIIWFHSASLGEFEQGRPVMEAFHNNFPDHKVLLTFFSPSGYEIRKETPVADFVYYLPLDSPQYAKRFITSVNPRMAIFIKYELWFNFINELSKHKIPTFVISSIFQPSQYIFKPWGKWPLHQLQKVTHFFVQDETSLALLNKANIYHAEVGGDTRFDRVLKLASEKVSYPIIEAFKSNGKTTIIAGSTWPSDEDILLKILKKHSDNYNLIVAPHEINNDHIGQLLQKFESLNPQIYSKAIKDNMNGSRVLIIDSIGLLSYLYRYAEIAYVGGGFGVGIHNLLEAVTYRIPVIFGPNFKKFKEAGDLLKLNAGYTISNAVACLEIFETLRVDHIVYEKSCKAAIDYVRSNSGATQQIIDKVKSYLIAK